MPTLELSSTYDTYGRTSLPRPLNTHQAPGILTPRENWEGSVLLGKVLACFPIFTRYHAGRMERKTTKTQVSNVDFLRSINL